MFRPDEIHELVRAATQTIDEDLEQEAALRAISAFRRAGHVEYPRAFLRKVVSDAVHDYWRRRRTCEDIEAIDERYIRVQPCLEEDIDRRRRTIELRDALARLKPSDRRLLNLFYEEDLSIAKIARHQKTSISAVKMQLLRARRELARIVRKNATKKSR